MASVQQDWTTGIIDLSHHQAQGIDWQKCSEMGIIAVIHKATEGLSFTDTMYYERRNRAKAAGMLWGSYHFAGDVGEDGAKQASCYLDFAKPTDDEFICFDCEKHGTLKQMEDFVLLVHERTGRLPAIYGRHLLNDVMKGNPQSVVTKCILWYDEYPPHPHSTPRHPLPGFWSDWTLWQYTNGRDGPEPHGIENFLKCGRSTFKGNAAQLRLAWPFPTKLVA